MSTPPRILAFSGSARKESLNRKLLASAIDAARAAGGEVTLVDLNEYAMPLYHGDLEDEQGMPESAQRLLKLITEHAGLLIASPEYNSAITPLLKNTIDWCTRGDDNPFVGKVVAIVSASPGQFGGIRSQLLARQLFTHLGSHVVPLNCTLSHADKAFDEQGQLKDERSKKSVKAIAELLVKTAAKLG